MTENEEKVMINEAKAKIFVDELSKSFPMFDYQKEILIRAIVDGCHCYLPYELEMKRLRQLYYCREMTRRLCEFLFFNKRRDDEESKTMTKAASEVCDVLKIIRRKDGVYDLFQNNNWIMSRGCVDNILEYLSKESEFRPVVLEFKDEGLEDCDEKTS